MGETAKWILLVHFAATMAMVGLIWFVQIVHYPLFSQVGLENFRRYELDHQRLTTWAVAPWMLLELFTAILLIWYRPLGIGSIPVWLGLMLLAAIWLITYSIQVPQHAALLRSYSTEVQRRLVTGNWFRTVAWTTRGTLVLWMVGKAISTIPSDLASTQLALNALP